MLKPYIENINKIKEELISIIEEVSHANKISLSALKENDLSMLKDVNLSIRKLAIKASDIDKLIVKTLALYSPEAKDLREMVSYLKITNELMRTAAYSKAFAKSFRKAFSEELDAEAILEYAIPLLKSANLTLQSVIEIIKETDEKIIEETYNKVLVEDSKTDDLYAMIEKNILKLITKNIELSKDYFEVLSSLRKIEKVSGRASSIASLLVFAEIGGTIENS